MTEGLTCNRHQWCIMQIVIRKQFFIDYIDIVTKQPDGLKKECNETSVSGERQILL